MVTGNWWLTLQLPCLLLLLLGETWYQGLGGCTQLGLSSNFYRENFNEQAMNK